MSFLSLERCWEQPSSARGMKLKSTVSYLLFLTLFHGNKGDLMLETYGNRWSCEIWKEDSQTQHLRAKPLTEDLNTIEINADYVNQFSLSKMQLRATVEINRRSIRPVARSNSHTCAILLCSQ